MAAAPAAASPALGRIQWVNSTSAQKPRVYLFGTGGTISFVGENRTDFANYSYQGHQLTIQEMLARVPEAEEQAEVIAEQVINVGSTEVYPSDWLTLANRINARFNEDAEAAGAAVTHGTATLEETAYFLNLTVHDARPVVVTGAMRPPSAMGTDADNNLMDAIHVASARQSAGRGALVVLNNEIQAARDVTKTDSYRVETFQSGHVGFLGYSDADGGVVYYRQTERRHTADSEFDVSDIGELPRVDIAFAYAGVDGTVVDALVDAGRSGNRGRRVGQRGFAGSVHGRPATRRRRRRARCPGHPRRHRASGADPPIYGGRLHRGRQLASQKGTYSADVGLNANLRYS